MTQQMATACAQSEDSIEASIKKLVPDVEERFNSVVFVFQPLPNERRVPALIRAKLKAEWPQKGRRRSEHDEEVKDFRVPISRSMLLFMEYASKGKLQLPHVVVDEAAGNGRLQPRLMGGKVKEDNGQLKLVAAPGRLPAQRVLNQELGRLGGDLLRTSKKHAHILEKNGIDPAMIKEFVDLLAQCKNSGWGVAIERPVSR
jgi:hypothetical protein